MTPPLTKSSATEKTPLLAEDAAQQNDASTLLTVRFGSPEEAWFGWVPPDRAASGSAAGGTVVCGVGYDNWKLWT